MKPGRLSHILFLWLALCSVPGRAQVGPVAEFALGASQQQYTDENGLPQNSVHRLAFDQAGFLWFSTSEGLVRFDGRRFRMWQKNPAIRHFIRYSTTRNLYVVDEGGRISLLRDGAAQKLPETLPGNAFLPGSPMLSYLWGQALPYAFNGTEYSYVVPAGNGWYYTLSGDTLTAFEGAGAAYFTRLPADAREAWRYFVWNGKLYHWSERGTLREMGRKIKPLLPTGDVARNPNYGRSGIETRPLVNSATGEVFIYLENALYAVESDAEGNPALRLIFTGFDFSDHAISCMSYDRAHGRLFVGSYTEGLFVFTAKRFRSLTFDEFVGQKLGNSYGAQVPYGNGRVLTSDGSILGPDAPADYLDHFADYADAGSLVRDAEGHIWSKRIFGLFRWDSKARKQLGIWQFNQLLSVVAEGPDSSLWIGTQEPGALYRLDIRHPQPTPEPVLNHLPDVTCIRAISPRMLCIGTADGLFVLDRSSGNRLPAPGLNGKYIRSLYADAAHPGEVWGIARGEGLFLYRGGKVVWFPADPEGWLRDARCLLRDSLNYFWVSTGKGLFSIAAGDLNNFADGKNERVAYFYYGKSAGFNSNEFSGACQPCGLALDNGYFSFPSLNGLVWFRPGQIAPEYPSAPIYLDGLLRDGEYQALGNDSVALPRDFRRLELRYTTPYFGHPYNLRFETRMDDGPWLPAAPDHISFNALESGKHVLYIRKINGSGADNFALRRVVFSIAPAFWETTWFIVLCVLGLIGVVFLYTRLRVLYVNRRNRLLEEAIAERTLELKETIRALRESKEIIGRDAELQKRLTATIAHDIKTPLKYLLLTTGSLSKTPPEALSGEHDTVKTVYQSLYRIYHFTDNLLMYIKSRFHDAGAGQVGTVNLRALVQEKIDIFHDIARNQGTEIHNHVSETITLRVDYNLISVVIHNVLDNAVKFTFNGKIICTAETVDAEIKLVITDTGVGIHPEQMEGIQLFFESDDQKWSPGYNQHSGLGLVIIKEIVKQLGGRLLMDSEKGEGTMVVLYFPE